MLFVEKILSYIATYTLWTLGWKLHTSDEMLELKRDNKCVIIFPHTTRFDFIIFALYMLAYPEEMRGIHLVMKPQLSKGKMAPFFNYFRPLSATRLEERGHGFVDSVVNRFINKYDAIICISPEGTIACNEWRSGYFHIAQQLNCPIKVAGLDYESHKLVSITSFSTSRESLEALEPKLKEEIKKIPVLYQDNSIAHEDNRRITTSPFNMDKFILRGFVPSMALLGLYSSPYFSLLGFAVLYSYFLL